MKKMILPFMIVFAHSAFAGSTSDMILDIVNQYKMLGKNKALVVAVDEDKYAAGWGFKFSSTKRAIAKAMKGCQKSRLNYQVHAECTVYMINDKLQENSIVQEIGAVVAPKTSSNTVSTSTTIVPVEEVVVDASEVQVDTSIEAVVEADEQMIMSVD